MKQAIKSSSYKAVVIGVSAGGLNALNTILSSLPGDFNLPILVVQHRSPTPDNYMVQALGGRCNIRLKEAEDGEGIEPGTVYIAPADYHMLVENNEEIALSKDERVNYARPSVDVLFESAADVYGSKLIGIILTGANNDGSYGLKQIKERGGLAIVQDPVTAQSDAMPRAAIAATQVDRILPLEQIGTFLAKLN